MSQNEALTDENKNEKAKKIIQVIAKFKADLLWDDIVGVFDMVPANVKDELEQHLNNAIKAASVELNVPSYDLRQQIEDMACDLVNGQTYSKEEIRARLLEYGVEVDVSQLSDEETTK